MKQTREQAKQEVMNFKSTLKGYWVHYKNPNADKVNWSTHDDEMFDYYYDTFKPIEVIDCSFTDSVHFLFDLGKRGYVDFTSDDFHKTFDIWAKPIFIDR